MTSINSNSGVIVFNGNINYSDIVNVKTLVARDWAQTLVSPTFDSVFTFQAEKNVDGVSIDNIFLQNRAGSYDTIMYKQATNNVANFHMPKIIGNMPYFKSWNYNDGQSIFIDIFNFRTKLIASDTARNSIHSNSTGASIDVTITSTVSTFVTGIEKNGTDGNISLVLELPNVLNDNNGNTYSGVTCTNEGNLIVVERKTNNIWTIKEQQGIINFVA